MKPGGPDRFRGQKLLNEVKAGLPPWGELDRLRAQALRRSRLIFLIGAALLAAGIYTFLPYEQPYSMAKPPVKSIVLAFIGSLVLWMLGRWPIAAFDEKFLKVFFERTGESLSYESYSEPESIDPALFHKLDLVPSYEKSSFWTISGACASHSFFLGLATLSTEGRSGNVTVTTTNFHGVLLRIQGVAPVSRPAQLESLTMRLKQTFGQAADFWQHRKYLSFDTERMGVAFHEQDLFLAVPISAMDDFFKPPNTSRPLGRQTEVLERLCAQVFFVREIVAQVVEHCATASAS